MSYSCPDLPRNFPWAFYCFKENSFKIRTGLGLEEDNVERGGVIMYCSDVAESDDEVERVRAPDVLEPSVQQVPALARPHLLYGHLSAV